jgi:hypothetical protein
MIPKFLIRVTVVTQGTTFTRFSVWSGVE